MPFNTSEFFGSALVQGLSKFKALVYAGLLAVYWNGRCEGIIWERFGNDWGTKWERKITFAILEETFYKEDGKWHNKAAKCAWTKCYEKHLRRKIAGKKGGEATAMLQQSFRARESESEVKEERKKIPKKETYENRTPTRTLSEQVRDHYQKVVIKDRPGDDQSLTTCLKHLDLLLLDGVWTVEKLCLAADRYAGELGKKSMPIHCGTFYKFEFEDFLAPEWKPAKKETALQRYLARKENGEPQV
jgi:hypothetical protein